MTDDFENEAALILHLRARVEALEAALRPFASIEINFPEMPDSCLAFDLATLRRLTLGDIRRAAALLAAPATGGERRE